MLVYTTRMLSCIGNRLQDKLYGDHITWQSVQRIGLEDNLFMG